MAKVAVELIDQGHKNVADSQQRKQSDRAILE